MITNTGYKARFTKSNYTLLQK